MENFQKFERESQQRVFVVRHRHGAHSTRFWLKILEKIKFGEKLDFFAIAALAEAQWPRKTRFFRFFEYTATAIVLQ